MICQPKGLAVIESRIHEIFRQILLVKLMGGRQSSAFCAGRDSGISEKMHAALMSLIRERLGMAFSENLNRGELLIRNCLGKTTEQGHQDVFYGCEAGTEPHCSVRLPPGST